jgi:ribonuclease HI
VVKSRTGSTANEWVLGHGNNLSNELVDEAATDAVQQNMAPWYVDLQVQTDIPYVAQCDGQQLEVDLLQFLKQQTTIRHHN